MCLVHENQDCIIDLVRNLNYCDPDSPIILYNGGTNKELFDHFPFGRYGAVIHPDSKPLKWGWLHDFAIDCMEYALEHFSFDLITVVDSDQLSCGKNYSQFVAPLYFNTPNLGMFGQIPGRLPLNTQIHPAITAYQEIDLWQPFLETLPNGKEAFLHWTFWPSTAFSFQAAKALVSLFRTNLQLQELLTKTSIWASEEIMFPTLTVALGFDVITNPCSYKYVQYKTSYSSYDIRNAVQNPDCFWIHPVERKINNANRIEVRKLLGDYSEPDNKSLSPISKLHTEIEEKTSWIEGWLLPDELRLLVDTCNEVMLEKHQPVIVEVGSYCGKSTGVIGLTAKALKNKSRIIAIDEFTGKLGAEDSKIDHYPPNYSKLVRNMELLELNDMVEIKKGRSTQINFTEKIDLLLIDGLHDYANVARDFFRFDNQLAANGLVLFHDCSQHFPGVVSFVNECLKNGNYKLVNKASSLVCIQKMSQPFQEKNEHAFSQNRFPLVSCIIPTYNRPQLLEKAIEQFVRQDYPNKELVIIDDSEQPFSKDLSKEQAIKYIHTGVRETIGKKRNRACEIASGKIIVHLDDDDFYANDWLTEQVSFLLENDLDVTGLNAPLFYHSETLDIWQYTYPEQEKPWVYGATLCYTKSFWESNPFRETNLGEDNHFVWNNKKVKLRAHPSLHSYLGNIHPGNTSQKRLKDERWKKVEKDKIPDLKFVLDHKNETKPEDRTNLNTIYK